ncbi:MAG: PD-(D/E)XK nuclease family protein [Acidiferrobacterales bacterium]
MTERCKPPRPPVFELIPYSEDPLRALGKSVLEHSACARGDLADAIVLLPHVASITRFRRVLLEVAQLRGVDILLAPCTATLAAWLRTHADPSRRQLGEIGRELLLLDALAQHTELTRRWGTWPLIDSLLGLFDEMALNRINAPDELPVLTRALAQGYKVREPLPAALSDEARLAHTLWKAWLAQLESEQYQDPTGALIQGLDRSLARLPSSAHVYLAGFVRFTRAEMDWIKALRARGQLTLLLHGGSGAHGYHPDAVITEITAKAGVTPGVPPTRSRYGVFLDRVFAIDDDNLPSRAHKQALAEHATPADSRLVIHEAATFEEEARAVDLRVRQWRLEGLRHIGIVTADRKLARRVRALLERASILVEDAAGWALSTTSAATVMMRWLECIEHNFAHDMLLDVLKSPFVSLGMTKAALRMTVSKFEDGLITRYNLGAGIDLYRRTLERRFQSLAQGLGEEVSLGIANLLDRLEQTAFPLQTLSRSPQPATAYLTALRDSLSGLGATDRYRRDEAGLQLLTVLDAMAAAKRTQTLLMTWSEFRIWLARTLERTYFRPPMRTSGVELMGFDQSRLCRFDGVVIAGALREYLPGAPVSAPFFNESVRRQLGLPSANLERYERLYDFRRLLEAAPRVLVSFRRQQRGEPATPSPWVERLRVFHELAYGGGLEDARMQRLATSPRAEITWTDAPLPVPRPRPRPTIPPAIVPKTVSASAHQRLINCPYRYFVVDALELGETPFVHEQLKKVDYGSRVHLILQAFHAGAAGLPGPFGKTLSEGNKDEAEMLLRRIGEAVFADDVRASFLARGWLLTWERAISPYVEYQVERAKTWQTAAFEVDKRRACSDGKTTVTIRARIDRLDRSDDGYGIVDYKTGEIASLADVAAGEQIQLPFYALATEPPIAQALFLGLASENISDRVQLGAGALNTLTADLRERLLAVHRSILDGAGLPAWGDELTCARCHAHGVCRKGLWLGSDSPGGL